MPEFNSTDLIVDSASEVMGWQLKDEDDRNGNGHIVYQQGRRTDNYVRYERRPDGTWDSCIWDPLNRVDDALRLLEKLEGREWRWRLDSPTPCEGRKCCRVYRVDNFVDCYDDRLGVAICKACLYVVQMERSRGWV